MKQLLLCAFFATSLCATGVPFQLVPQKKQFAGVSWTVPRYGWGGLLAGGGVAGAIAAHKKMWHHAHQLVVVRTQLAKDPDNCALQTLEKKHASKKRLYQGLFALSIASAAGGGVAISDTFRRATLVPWCEQVPSDFYSERQLEPEDLVAQKLRRDKNERPYTYKGYVRQGIQMDRSLWQQLLNPWINWSKDTPVGSLNEWYVEPYLRRVHGQPLK